MCVTETKLPLGNLINILTVEVIEVKREKKLTMWSVAPISRIQAFLDWKKGFLESNTEDKTVPNRFKKELVGLMVEVEWVEPTTCIVDGVGDEVFGEGWIRASNWWHWSCENGSCGMGCGVVVMSKPRRDVTLDTWFASGIRGLCEW